MRHTRSAVLACVFALLASACLAPPPPIVVDTPFGSVRASSEAKAEEVAGLLEELAPRVQELLPGSQEREIDVWVQDELRVYRFHKRPESVRGFTLLSDEFHAKRIHLQEDGQSPWYLAHELVHALIGPSWRTLPGILEEGLSDVVAEELNPNYADHIRAHRLLNASAVTGGFYVRITYSHPDPNLRPREWRRRESASRVQTAESIPLATIQELFTTPRSELHRRWPEIPEAFYGFSWLVVSRITERHGLHGLHRLCEQAESEGLELVPAEWLFAAADIDPDELGPSFLTSCFGRGEMLAAANLQPDLFTELAFDLLRPIQANLSPRDLLRFVNPAFRLDDGSELRFRFIYPLRDGIYRAWRDARRRTAEASGGSGDRVARRAR